MLLFDIVDFRQEGLVAVSLRKITWQLHFDLASFGHIIGTEMKVLNQKSDDLVLLWVCQIF
jgi:hypothetical protein